MTIISRKQLLKLDTELFAQLFDNVPPDIEDNLMLLLVDLYEGGQQIEIADEYISHELMTALATME